MKTIDKIFDDLHYELITEKQAKQQVLDLFSVSNSASGIIELDTKIQLLPRKWWQLYKRGWQTHTDFFGRRYFVRYHWVK
jgi:hypothetical protein